MQTLVGFIWFILFPSLGDHMFWNALVMTTVGVTISGPYNLIVGSISIDLGSQPALAGNSQAMSTVSGLLDGTGSAGSAIGQLIIPFVQDNFGWKTVFYFFIVLVIPFLKFSKIFNLEHSGNPLYLQKGRLGPQESPSSWSGASASSRWWRRAWRLIRISAIIIAIFFSFLAFFSWGLTHFWLSFTKGISPVVIA